MKQNPGTRTGQSKPASKTGTLNKVILRLRPTSGTTTPAEIVGRSGSTVAASCSRGRKNQCRKSRAPLQSEADHQNKQAQVQGWGGGGGGVVRGEASAERRRGEEETGYCFTTSLRGSRVCSASIFRIFRLSVLQRQPTSL